MPAAPMSTIMNATIALVLLGILSACAPACGSGAASGEAAVAGLISAARDADTRWTVAFGTLFG